MKRGTRALLLGGAAAMIMAILWGLLAGDRLMLSYLAAWLIAASLPFGAMVLLLILQVSGGGAADLAPMLQRLALGAPLAALGFIPVLLGLHAVYPWIQRIEPDTPFGRAWLHPGLFALRAIVMLTILTVLALRAALAGGPRRAGALPDLLVASLVGTLAADDWVMSLTPAWHSGAFGLLLISGQTSLALAAAILLTGAAGMPPGRAAAPLLAIASAAWGTLHFLQFLVMWSADLPAEAAWYLARDAGGRAFEWFAFLAGFLLPVALTVLSRRRQDRLLPAVAALALLAHVIEMLWLVTPSLRRHFVISVPDLLMLAGLGSLAACLATAVRLRSVTESDADRAVT